MKLCTKIWPIVVHVSDGVHLLGDAEIIDVSFVPDDHEFGLADDKTLHIEADPVTIAPPAG